MRVYILTNLSNDHISCLCVVNDTCWRQAYTVLVDISESPNLPGLFIGTQSLRTHPVRSALLRPAVHSCADRLRPG